MSQDPLIDVPKDRVPRRVQTRAQRGKYVKEMREKYGIFTHAIEGVFVGKKDWMAFSVPQCLKNLNGYNLTDEEKKDPISLFAGYCRLMDERGLLTEGHRTEFEAVSAIVENLES